MSNILAEKMGLFAPGKRPKQFWQMPPTPSMVWTFLALSFDRMRRKDIIGHQELSRVIASLSD